MTRATFPRAGTRPNTTARDARRRLPSDLVVFLTPLPRQSGHLARRRSRHGPGGRRRPIKLMGWLVCESAGRRTR